MTQKSLTLDDLKGSLRTLLCQSCGIVVERLIVGHICWPSLLAILHPRTVGFP